MCLNLVHDMLGLGSFLSLSDELSFETEIWVYGRQCSLEEGVCLFDIVCTSRAHSRPQ